MADGQTPDRSGPATKPRPDAAERAGIRIPKTAELVADVIRRMITSGELTEGDTLQPEAQIIQEFAVSRPTVREAFRILESEKLISVSRGSRGGARVHVPKVEQVARYAGFVLQSRKATYRNVYQARIIIEPPAARMVAEGRSKDAPAILRQVIEEQRQKHEADDFGRAVARFHSRLIELTGNEALILVFSMLDGIVASYQAEVSRSQRQVAPASRRSAQAGLRSQEKLVEFIEAGDGAGAEAHWRAHMENTARVWLDAGPADSVVDWRD
jgi:DNA-binding FadR family transcriptional regulator